GETAIASRHRLIIEKLRALGDEESARLLEELGEMATRPPDPQTAAVGVELEPSTPVRLLVAAQEPLEALGEALEAFMSRVEGDLFTEAEKAMASVIVRTSRISLQVERRMPYTALAPPGRSSTGRVGRSCLRTRMQQYEHGGARRCVLQGVGSRPSCIAARMS